MTNTSPLVFPNRGAQTAVGTNPISIIAEGKDGDKFALDMATSTVAIGKVCKKPLGLLQLYSSP